MKFFGLPTMPKQEALEEKVRVRDRVDGEST